MTIGTIRPAPYLKTEHIYCPSLFGLSTRLADAAFLLPRMDQNRTVMQAKGYGHWAAAIAADPFGSNDAYFRALKEAGYKGVVNWPSSILLEGPTQQQMSTIPASPATEYAYLAKAKENGLMALGFVLTPDHAKLALSAGVKDLVLHPGILLEFDAAGTDMIRRALASIIDRIRRNDSQASVRLYTSLWHDDVIGLGSVDCDGFVRFEEDAR